MLATIQNSNSWKNRSLSVVTDQSLGRLERVDLRTIWTSEPAEFTPWLAQPGNLEILGETLGLELQPESVEKEVGFVPVPTLFPGTSVRIPWC